MEVLTEQHTEQFRKEITEGIPAQLPDKQERDPNVSHAPNRKQILSESEKKLALENALRYFPPGHHKELLTEFKDELEAYGRIYMYRLKPSTLIKARPIEHYPAKCLQAASIMLMIQNNLDPAVA
ncbi:MAG: urocanate hydratase, partial [Bacteroidota bacterium]